MSMTSGQYDSHVNMVFKIVGVQQGETMPASICSQIRQNLTQGMSLRLKSENCLKDCKPGRTLLYIIYDNK